jgi:hypothetical protein
MKINLNNIKETGFKTPDNYFDAIEDNIMDAIQQENSGDAAKETGFKTPEKYFDALEDVIINKIENDNSPKVIALFSKRNLIYASSIAAAILLLFNLSIFDKEDPWNSLENLTLENYIIDEGIDTYELAALLSEDYLLEEDFIQQNITDETLENYLLDNLDFEELIIEEQ